MSSVPDDELFVISHAAEHVFMLSVPRHVLPVAEKIQLWAGKKLDICFLLRAVHIPCCDRLLSEKARISFNVRTPVNICLLSADYFVAYCYMLMRRY